MTKMPKKERENLSAFMTDFWILIKKYWIPEDKDSPYWDELVDEVKALLEKYNRHPFVRAQLCGFLNYEDAEMKRRYSNDAG